VPDRPFLPAPREEVAVLAPQGGAGWEEPRFLTDGRHLTVIRAEVLPDGRSMPDLWVWDADSGDVRRVTRGAAIRSADPFPDGLRAAGVRCLAGQCDLVLVDLTTGAVAELARGAFDANYSGVRVSPDGRWVASARQADGRWEVVRVEVATGTLRPLLPRDEASRYEPTWLPDGSGLVVVSEATGTPQLERIALDGAATPLTRFAGLTSLPDVSRDGRTFFLAMHARGWDLRTIRLDSAASPARVVLADSLAPVAPRQRITDAKAFPTTAVGSLPYGIGRLGATWLPNANFSAEGQDQSGSIVVTDVVGRFGAVLQGGYGERAVWRGGSLAVTWRGLRPSLGVQAFATRHLPSQQSYEPLLDGSFDAEYRGIAVVTERTHPGTTGTISWRAAASQGSLQGRAAPCITCLAIWAPIPAGARAVVAGQLAANRTFTPRGVVRIVPSFTADLAAGRTDGTAWRRAQVQGGLRVGGWAAGGLELQAQYGQVSADAPGYERFALGGAASPYVDPLLLQGRWEAPGQGFGALTGTRAFRARVALAGAFLQVDHAGVDALGPGRRLVGFETVIATPPLPAARFPAFRAKTGLAMPLDGPRRRDAVFYATLVLTP
ncbi:MAG: TolB family protein, partial [Gemmatimonadota bacterium]